MRLLHGCPAFLIGVFVAGAIASAAPQRVVSTNLCADEYVYRLVPREHIAALSFLAADRNPVVSTIADKVSGIHLIRGSFEEVFTLSPDLVVLYQGANPRLREHLIEAHIPIVEIPWTDSLADVRSATLRIGRQLGAPDRALALVAHMDGVLADAHRRATHPPVPTLIYEPNGYATSGTIADEIMSAADLSDVASTLEPTRSGTIPIEAVIADAPKLIVLNRSSGQARSEAELMLQHPALAALNERTTIASLNLTPLLCAGPWSVDVAPDEVPAIAGLHQPVRFHPPRGQQTVLVTVVERQQAQRDGDSLVVIQQQRRQGDASAEPCRGPFLSALASTVLGMDTDRHVDLDWNEELVSQLEWYWVDRLRPRLHGLTDDAEISLLRDLYGARGDRGAL